MLKWLYSAQLRRHRGSRPPSQTYGIDATTPGSSTYCSHEVAIVDGYTHDGSICEICIQAKHERKIIRISVQRTTALLELVHSDTCGPLATKEHRISLSSSMTTRDTQRSASSRTSARTRVSVFQSWGYDIKRFRCNSGEYDKFFRSILAARGIRFEPAPPYTQHKNGVAERMIGTFTEKASTMMLDSQVPMEFWAEAVLTACYLHARTPSRALDGKTPYEMLHTVPATLERHDRCQCRSWC